MVLRRNTTKPFCTTERLCEKTGHPLLSVVIDHVALERRFATSILTFLSDNADWF